ncbi:hypothetical protein E3P81_02494 [Wallemia ichthyophaga]|uniref:Uncharacterized protein n=1 Tax=Wallemia ichthyophaga TaxID=245174 RepID=A0A4T0K8Z2_WALIC|nr:hypothetical protein E3P97_02502 [Wallemia ichthyophaga]TIB06760.1 hypothetical protein E3P96_00091 [Wallemia ichthyophaga]TIB31513.1 hypothetical protein E3P85_02218 [Wallemia ichthyophaga]TIB42198.1 hypothetical protein E3P86_00458 [Wallemia ichthyophaga]TIB45961.1 hypothetical protein E3P82_02494 [Wallemia ichthyophaga]
MEVFTAPESIESAFPSSSISYGSQFGLDPRAPGVEITLRNFEKWLPDPTPSPARPSTDSIDLHFTLTAESERNSMIKTRNENYEAGKAQEQPSERDPTD